jgi:hypothetical protein
MNLTAIARELSNSSLYDLYQLSRIISTELDNSTKLETIKNSINLGQKSEYLNPKTNQLIPVTILEKQAKKVLVEYADHSRWWIRYYMLNLSGVEFVRPITKYLDKNTLSIGSVVSFEGRRGLRVVGTVSKLNPKTAVVITQDNHKWSVYYEHLSAVVDINNVIDVLPYKN